MDIDFTDGSIGAYVHVGATSGLNDEFEGQIVFDVRVSDKDRGRRLEWVCSNLTRESATALRDHLTELLGD